MKTLALLYLATTLSLLACNKTADTGRGSGAETSQATQQPDRIQVLARHLPAAGKEDLDADPVVVRFEKFAVTKAHFDPNHLEGGTATIELDPTSMKTGNEERDGDLKAPDYLDVGKFATITIDVANVKKQADKYSADATVSCHGITKTYPITFQVLAATADSVRVMGEHSFSRVDFGIGIDPATDPTERVAAPVTIQWTLTLKKT